MFNLIKQQKQIYSSLIVSNFGHEAFGFSDEITSSEAEEAMKDKTSMAVLINTRKINLNNQDHINLAVKFLKEMSLENPSGMITEEQLGSLFKGTTESALNNLASLILLGARGGQSKVDALNNFLKKNSGNATRAPLSLLPNGTTTTAPRLSNTPQQSPETKGLREDSLDAILTNFENVVKPIRERAVSEQKPLSAQDRQKIIEAEKLATTQIRRITKAGTNNVRERQDVIVKIQSQKAELLNGFESVRTQEIISKPVEGNRDRIEQLKKFDSDSLMSLTNILKKSNLGQISLDIINIVDKASGEKDYNDTSAFREYLKSLGYVVDGMRFDEEEAMAVYQTIMDYVATQNQISGMKPIEKLEILVDFNRDGRVNKNLSFSVGEAQIREMIKEAEKSSNAIDNLFANLGFGTLGEFTNQMRNNLFTARESFKRALGVYIQMGVTPVELMKKGGVKGAIDKLNADQNKVISEVDKTLANSPKLAKKLETITDKAKREEASSKIRIAAIGILVGSSFGAGASIDVSEFTDHIIDSVQVGVSTAGWFVGISKEIFNKDGYGAYLNLSTIGPSLTGTKTFDNGVSFGAGVSLIGFFGTIGYEDMSINSSKGIEKEVKDMSKKLDILVEDILAGESFENSKFAKLSGNNINKIFYEEFRNSYQMYGTNYGKKFLIDITNAYLEDYRNQLYYQAQGFKFTSIGLGAAYGFLTPILVFFSYIGGESIKQRYKGYNNRINDQREISRESISPSDVGYEEVNYKGYNMARISENSGVFNISHPSGQSQYFREGGYLYFSGVINSLDFDRHYTNGGVIRTVVINGGEKLPNGLYDPADQLPINQNIEVRNSIATTDKLKINQEAIESTRYARSNIFNIVDFDALNHTNTPGMQKLQKLAFDYKNGRGNLNTVWEAFLQVFVKNSKIDLYAAKKDAAADLLELRSFVSLNLSDYEKIMLIQTVPACLMKKPGLRLGADGRVQMKEKLSEDKKRNAFFDGIFTAKFPGLKSRISNAREEWFKANGDQDNYGFKDISDGSIAFSATESKTSKGVKNVSGVMRYEGAYHVLDAKEAFIEIPGKSEEVVNNLGNEYLTSLLKTLQDLKVPNMRTTADVKAFINKGGNSEVQINYKLLYCKMGECKNDAVTIDLQMISKGRILTIGSTMSGEVYVAENTSTKYGIVGAVPVKDFSKKDTTSSGETGTTGPGETGETGPSGPTTTPGTQPVTPPTQTPTPTPQTPTPQTPQTPTTYTSNRG